MRLRTGPRRERGASLIEFAMLLPLLLILAIGAFEFGMLFRDSLSISTASRAAARVGASSANYGDADCVILEAAAGSIQSLESGTIDQVHIYKSDSSGSIPTNNSSFMRRYSPFQTGDPSLIACSGSDWNAEYLGTDWEPADRNNNPANSDWIGVRIQYDHAWFTGLAWFNGTFALEDEAVFRIEPPVP